MRKLLFCLAVSLPVLVLSQVTEDFTDGELAENPCWYGDTSHFKVSWSPAIPLPMRPGLQLDAPSAGSSGIFLQFGDLSSLTWCFWLKMSFNSSANNFARIILMADRADPSGAFHGYFLQVGGSNDSIIFCRQDSLDVQTLLVFPGLYAGNSTNAFRWMVSEYEGHWEFFADPSGGDQLAFQGELTETGFSGGNYFMLQGFYTSSNITKIYFDDIHIDEYFPDTIPPILEDVKILSSSSLQLGFDESLEVSQALNVANYQLSGFGNPILAEMADSRHILLRFSGEMADGVSYTLKVLNATDLYGNVSGEITAAFVFSPLKAWDVLITEIMADPTPSHGLPEAEYIELYNREPHPLDIGRCRIKMDEAEVSIPFGTELDSHEYALLLPGELASEFAGFGKVIAVEGLDLGNKGAFLMLADSSGQPIDCFTYDETWYHDDIKSGGGWSLERIDPGMPCLGPINWTASGGYNGGTPCAPSGFGIPLPGPVRLVNACCLDAFTVSVEFDRKMDPGHLSDPGLYSADHGAGYPLSVIAGFPDPVSATLTFDSPLREGVNYTLSVSEGMTDCMGDLPEDPVEISFGLPSKTGFMDVVINEVLFNPLGDGVDYIELFNCSSNMISFDSLILASVEMHPPAPPDTDTYALPGGCLALMPGSYRVLTTDPSAVMAQYRCPDPGCLISMDPFPPLDNTGGWLILEGLHGEILDEMRYEEGMHFPLLTTFEGVALERIYCSEPGTRADNWHSASWSAGLGTPGYGNSQSQEVSEANDPMKIAAKAFSPDGDGLDDILTISCHFDSPGWLGRIWIFDSNGNRVRLLIDNELMGTDNAFAWDGLADDRSKAAPGIYVILLESVDLEGHTTRSRKAVALVVR